MDRPSCVVALLAALLLGCGQSNPPPGPAPAFQPPANSGTPSAPPVDEKAEPASPAGQGVVSEEMPAEEKEEMTVEDTPAEKTVETPDEDAAANDETVADEEAASAAPARPKGAGGKLLRGLGNSLSRALSKASSGAAASNERRAPPKLEDDPFPKGEPADNKPNE
ncbi:MAG TPA: hypothetical protein VNH11_14255 [Pirellulales bacterium]|nr:hypothetical protein [Pirellulales bacterium]